MAIKNKGRHARTKGHSFERKLAKDFRDRDIFPDAKRHLEMQKEEAKGYDLDNTGPYRIQCKRHKKYAPITAIEEVQCLEGEIPVLVTKPDNKPAVAVLPLDHWMEMLIALKELTLLKTTSEKIVFDSRSISQIEDARAEDPNKTRFIIKK